MTFNKSGKIILVSVITVVILAGAAFFIINLLKNNAEDNINALSNPGKTVAEMPSYTALDYSGPDTNKHNSSFTIQLSDKAIIKKVWQRLRFSEWTEAETFDSTSNISIILNFKKETGQETYVLTPDGAGYFRPSINDSVASNAVPNGPFGVTLETDKSYTISSEIYRDISEILKENEPDLFSFNLDGFFEDVLTSVNTTISYEERYIKRIETQHLLDEYMNAFGDLEKWKQINNIDIVESDKSVLVYTGDIEISFFLQKDIVYISKAGNTAAYKVPPGVMDDFMKVVKKEKSAAN